MFPKGNPPRPLPQKEIKRKKQTNKPGDPAALFSFPNRLASGAPSPRLSLNRQLALWKSLVANSGARTFSAPVLPPMFTVAPARCGYFVSRQPLPGEFEEGNAESAQAMERQWKLCVWICTLCVCGGRGGRAVTGQLFSGLRHPSLSPAQPHSGGPPLRRLNPRASCLFPPFIRDFWCTRG